MQTRTLTTAPIEPAQIKKLTPWARNARAHSKKQVRQIADSVKQFGLTKPELVDEVDTILAGYPRVAAAKLIGMYDEPCLRFDRMTA